MNTPEPAHRHPTRCLTRCLTRRLTRRGASILGLGLAALLAACATPMPVVVPPEPVNVAREQRIRGDIEHCTARADRHVGRNALVAAEAPRSAAGEANADNAKRPVTASGAREGARRIGQAAAVGFGATAIATSVGNSGAVWQRARAAAAGGGVGLAIKLVTERHEPDDVYQAYVERCLSARGHEVLGWR